MHVHNDVLPDHALRERNEVLGNPTENEPRIDAGVRRGQLFDERRHANIAAAHRFGKKVLFGVDVPEDGRRRDLQLASNIGQGRRFEPLFCEKAGRGLHQSPALDRRGPAHL